MTFDGMLPEQKRLTAADRAMLAAIDARRDHLVGRAIGWANINSGSSNLEGLAQVANLLMQELETLPGMVERIALPSVTRLSTTGDEQAVPQGDCLRLTVRPDAPMQIALTGHFDTVFDSSHPFQSVSPASDGLLNGPGIADMKGGISVMLGALQAFEDHPHASDVGYTVLLSPDEETGSLASAPLLAALGERARLGMTFEPGLADGTMISTRKGSGNFQVLFKGRSAHAGRDFANGRNAVAAAVRVATAIDALNGHREGVTLNIARIDGGGPPNIVPDRAILHFNVRAPNAEAMAWVLAAIDEALTEGAADGIDLSLHGGMNRPPKPFTSTQEKLFHHVRSLAGLIGQEMRWAPSGGVCEGNNLFAAGIPNIDTLGVRGGAIHSAEEFAIIDSFIERTQLSALLLSQHPAG